MLSQLLVLIPSTPVFGPCVREVQSIEKKEKLTANLCVRECIVSSTLDLLQKTHYRTLQKEYSSPQLNVARLPLAPPLFAVRVRPGVEKNPNILPPVPEGLCSVHYTT